MVHQLFRIRNRTVYAWLLGIAIITAAALVPVRGHAAEPREIIVAGGCFWCVEKDFETVDGVIEAV